MRYLRPGLLLASVLALGAISVGVGSSLTGGSSSTPELHSTATANATTVWSTAAKSAGPTYAPSGLVVTNARGVGTGTEGGITFERITFDSVSGTRSTTVGYSVQYVSQVTGPGSGEPLPLTGAAKLQVVIRAPAYNQAGQPTYYATGGQDLPGIRPSTRLVDTVYAGAFEGWTTFGLGLTAQRPFRVVQLSDGRVAVDVQR